MEVRSFCSWIGQHIHIGGKAGPEIRHFGIVRFIFSDSEKVVQRYAYLDTFYIAHRKVRKRIIQPYLTQPQVAGILHEHVGIGSHLHDPVDPIWYVQFVGHLVKIRAGASKIILQAGEIDILSSLLPMQEKTQA